MMKLGSFTSSQTYLDKSYKGVHAAGLMSVGTAAILQQSPDAAMTRGARSHAAPQPSHLNRSGGPRPREIKTSGDLVWTLLGKLGVGAQDLLLRVRGLIIGGSQCG